MLMKLTPKVNFTNIFTQNFYALMSQKHKKTVKSLVFFCAFPICSRKKLQLKCWWNWHQTGFVAYASHGIIGKVNRNIAKVWVHSWFQSTWKSKLMADYLSLVEKHCLFYKMFSHHHVKFLYHMADMAPKCGQRAVCGTPTYFCNT